MCQHGFPFPFVLNEWVEPKLFVLILSTNKDVNCYWHIGQMSYFGAFNRNVYHLNPPTLKKNL